MTIELGWAFFCRYEACFESFLKKNKVQLTKNCSLHDWLLSKGIDIPIELEPGLKCYRKIRNQLHHEDGGSFEGDSETEIHIMPDQMEDFYRMFVWCGAQIQAEG
ncbi:MAG: hypothetical protein KDK97_24585 [Verrucomicrobiales bacterium]|nr:hypothetical protein [Verrucomicrobiales bacterium]